MMQRSSLRTLPWSAPLVLLLAGCGHTDKFVPVEGAVTLDGKPLASVTLFLIPSDTAGLTAMGTSGQDGSFRMVTNKQDGAKSGDYKIIVGVVAPPLADPYEAYTEEMQIRARAKKGPASSVPAIYNSAATTPLRCRVPIEGKLVVELHSSGLPAAR
jgi:hypothetical protein